VIFSFSVSRAFQFFSFSCISVFQFFVHFSFAILSVEVSKLQHPLSRLSFAVFQFFVHFSFSQFATRYAKIHPNRNPKRPKLHHKSCVSAIFAATLPDCDAPQKTSHTRQNSQPPPQPLKFDCSTAHAAQALLHVPQIYPFNKTQWRKPCLNA
jgi:hypothetical protein